VYVVFIVEKISFEHRDFIRPRASSRWRSGAIYRELKKELAVGLEFEFQTMSGCAGQSSIDTLCGSGAS
jgi:hypothetical protein